MGTLPGRFAITGVGGGIENRRDAFRDEYPDRMAVDGRRAESQRGVDFTTPNAMDLRMPAAPSPEKFAAHVIPVLTRYLVQNALPALEPIAARAYADALRREGERLGWERVQRAGDGELAEEWVKAAIVRVLAALPAPRADLAGVTKQLLKGCYQPDFVPCRESYRETTGAGECRRQSLATALGRASGTHCVDCPYWRELAPAEHTAWLAARWVGDAAVFHENRGVFLPEDFRALRRVARGE